MAVGHNSTGVEGDQGQGIASTSAHRHEALDPVMGYKMGEGSGAQAETILRLDHNNCNNHDHNQSRTTASSHSLLSSTPITTTNSDSPAAMSGLSITQLARSFFGGGPPALYQPHNVEEEQEQEEDQEISHQYSPTPIIVRDFATRPLPKSSKSKPTPQPILSPEFFHPYHALGEYDMFILLSSERLLTGFPLPPKPMRRLLDLKLIPISDQKRWLPMDIQALHEYDLQCAKNLSRGREVVRRQKGLKRGFSFFGLFSSSSSAEEEGQWATNLPAYAGEKIMAPGKRGGAGQYPYVFPAWMEFPGGHPASGKGHLRQPSREERMDALCAAWRVKRQRWDYVAKIADAGVEGKGKDKATSTTSSHPDSDPSLSLDDLLSIELHRVRSLPLVFTPADEFDNEKAWMRAWDLGKRIQRASGWSVSLSREEDVLATQAAKWRAAAVRAKAKKGKGKNGRGKDQVHLILAARLEVIGWGEGTRQGEPMRSIAMPKTFGLDQVRVALELGKLGDRKSVV